MLATVYMPEGHDPMGYLALQQQINKERRCTINFIKSRNQVIAADPKGAYIVSNPITHVDTLIEVGRRPSTTASARSVDSRQGGRADSKLAANESHEKQLNLRVKQLEATLDEERSSRLKVQSELDKLQKLLEQHLATKK